MKRVIYDLNKIHADVAVPTTLMIPVGLKNKIAQSFWSYREIISLGIKAKEDNPQLIARIRELEESNTKLIKKLTWMSQKIYELGGDPNA